MTSAKNAIQDMGSISRPLSANNSSAILVSVQPVRSASRMRSSLQMTSVSLAMQDMGSRRKVLASLTNATPELVLIVQNVEESMSALAISSAQHAILGMVSQTASSARRSAAMWDPTRRTAGFV
jgi:hypothetical protein